MRRYFLDANVFIQAKNLHYGFDFCPAFWDWLEIANGKGVVFSIEKVKEELLQIDDELAHWADNHDESFFLPPDEQVLTAFPEVSRWVKSQSYDPPAIYAFLQDTDYYLIAHALAHSFTVVTHEVPSDSKKRIKIPNVCIGLNIKTMNTYEMLRREHARFVLQKEDVFP